MTNEQKLERLKYWFEVCCWCIADHASRHSPIVTDLNTGCEVDKNHPIRRLLENPNEEETGSDLFRISQYNLEKYGLSYLWESKNCHGTPVELNSLPPHKISTICENDLVKYYSYFRGNLGSVQIPVDEIIKEEAVLNSTRRRIQTNDVCSLSGEDKWIMEYVTATFHIPLSVIGYKKDLTYGGLLIDAHNFAVHCLDLRLKKRGEELTKWFGTRFKDTQIKWKSTVPSDPQKVNEEIKEGMLTPNEIRKLRGRLPFEREKLSLDEVRKIRAEYLTRKIEKDMVMNTELGCSLHVPNNPQGIITCTGITNSYDPQHMIITNAGIPLVEVSKGCFVADKEETKKEDLKYLANIVKVNSEPKEELTIGQQWFNVSPPR